jgi:hypothetical protein
MRKLKIMEHISLDGVIQQSADGGDFPYADWSASYRTEAVKDATLAAQVTDDPITSINDLIAYINQPSYPPRFRNAILSLTSMLRNGRSSTSKHKLAPSKRKHY